MSALNRLKRLAAVLTLLLFVTTTALAGPPGKPVDRPEGPPEPNPTEVGEPDTGYGLPKLFQMYWRQLIRAGVLSHPGFTRLALPAIRTSARPHFAQTAGSKRR